ncbi:MAG: hypothetical protein AAF389_07965 [Gemmatimonadota bacterium]
MKTLRRLLAVLLISAATTACGPSILAPDHVPDSGSHVPDSGSHVPDSGSHVPDSGS